MNYKSIILCFGLLCYSIHSPSDVDDQHAEQMLKLYVQGESARVRIDIDPETQRALVEVTNCFKRISRGITENCKEKIKRGFRKILLHQVESTESFFSSLSQKGILDSQSLGVLLSASRAKMMLEFILCEDIQKIFTFISEEDRPQHAKPNSLARIHGIIRSVISQGDLTKMQWLLNSWDRLASDKHDNCAAWKNELYTCLQIFDEMDMKFKGFLLNGHNTIKYIIENKDEYTNEELAQIVPILFHGLFRSEGIYHKRLVEAGLSGGLKQIFDCARTINGFSTRIAEVLEQDRKNDREKVESRIEAFDAFMGQEGYVEHYLLNSSAEMRVDLPETPMDLEMSMTA